MKHVETVPAPTLPRDELLRDPKTCQLSDDGDHLLVYDPERGSGAIYNRMQQTWLIHSPITPFQWLQALDAAGLRPQHLTKKAFDELVSMAVGCADDRPN